MKSKHYQKVEEFMQKAGQEVPTSPTLPSLKVRELRAKIIYEEALETIHGLGFSVQYDNYNSRNHDVLFVDEDDPNLEDIIDGCCDIKVVTTGTLIACGLPDDPFQDEVDDNNLAKFGPGHSIRGDGKLIKPPGHKPPKIKEILDTLKG